MLQKDLDVIRHGLKLSLARSPKGYRFEETPQLPPARFNHSEALALLLAVHTGRGNSGIAPAWLDAAVARLEALFPPEFNPHVKALGRQAQADGLSGTADHRREMLALLSVALMEGRKVCILYRTSSRGGAAAHRVVCPYHILPYVRSWHLVAHCERRNTVLTFKVDRIEEAIVLKDRYAIPEDFRLEDHIGEGWGLFYARDAEADDVELLFEPEAGRWVSEEHWHKSQQVETLPDARVRFRLHLPITPDFVAWILYYGWRVEVIAPASLRERVAEEHRRAAGQYGKPGP